jgi:ADP-ribose pyrophosphatase YjhB (NUDIX family)
MIATAAVFLCLICLTRSTMKRRLTDKLVLLVKARGPAAAAAAAGSDAAVWTFPTAAHRAGESIREAAERALKEAIGPSQVGQRVYVCEPMRARVNFLFETCHDTGAGMCLPQQDGHQPGQWHGVVQAACNDAMCAHVCEDM